MRMKHSKSDRTHQPAEQIREEKILVNLRCSAMILRNQSVLLCRRVHSDDTWVLPGGTPRLGEGTALSAQREVHEETGLQVTVDRVAFVLETTSPDWDHHLIEIVFVGKERNPNASPEQQEAGLVPSFVPLDELDGIGLRPPIAGYIRGYSRHRRTGLESQQLYTAAYLGNLWRLPDDD
ncbi:MAG: NUDIX hydrolase [Acidimicrobiaceae bacterium]|nr:NUDIX hydrolase [Acidimicrobiaceae bacterium]